MTKPPPEPATFPLLAFGCAVGGAAVGAVDAAVAWSQMGQFAGFGGKAGATLFSASIYAVAAIVLLAPLLRTIVAAARAIGGNALAMTQSEWGHEAGANVRRTTLVIGVVFPLLLAGGLGAAWFIGRETVEHRNHSGLISAVIVLAATAATITATVAAAALGRAVGGSPRFSFVDRAAGPRASLAAMPATLAVLAAVGAASSWDTLRLLDLRPLVVAGSIIVCSLAAARLLMARTPRLLTGRFRLGWRLTGALLGMLLVLTLLVGGSSTVQKAARATGLSAVFTRVARAALDLDRDGYSALLAGGDCDDLDADTHPGAVDPPNDGVDQDCSDSLGGDAAIPRDPGFVEPPPNASELNVLLITIDTLRPDHLGAYGYERSTSPTLDALADDGTLFESAWATSPSTRYSMPAILTGRYPSEIAWDHSIWWPGLDPRNLLLGELLDQAGLHTAAILNNDYFDPIRGMDQGIRSYDNENARLHRGRDPASTRGKSARQQSDKAVAFVRKNAGGRFFLWVHYYDPHYHYERHDDVKSFGDETIDLYDHEILATDLQIARVIEALKAEGIYDKTAVFVTGDHGEGFGEHGVDFHGYHLYAAQTRVPMIARVPGLAPSRVADPVSIVDIYPTIANVVANVDDVDVSGKSLLGEMRGRASTPRPIFQEVQFEGPTELRAAISGKYHLIYNVKPENTWELYDLSADPDETRDLYAARQDEVADLRAQLLRWTAASRIPPYAAQDAAEAKLERKPSPKTPSDATIGGLRLLGFDTSTARARRGEKIELTWYFQADEPAEQDWRMFVHVEGPTRFQADHAPARGSIPTSKWEGFYADHHVLRVPKNARPGTYRVWIGLYAGKQRAPVSGGGAVDNRLPAFELEVVP